MRDYGYPGGDPERSKEPSSRAGRESRRQALSDCDRCGKPISPGNTWCSECRHSQEGFNIGSDGSSWSLDRLALAVVSAISEYHATALANTAFKLRPEVPTADGNCDLFFGMDDPSKTLTSRWSCDIPDTVGVSEAKDLIEVACAQVGWEATVTGSEYDIQGEMVAEGETRLFAEDRPVTDADSAQTLLNQTPEDDEELYVIPGVLYDEDTEQEDSVPTVTRGCPACGNIGDHEYKGHPVHEGVEKRQRGEYVCLNCDTRNIGPAPDMLPDYD